MADPNWRTNKDIQLARKVAQWKGAAAAIVLLFKANGEFSVVSYGKNGPVCVEAGKIADQIHAEISEEQIDTFDLSKAMARVK